MEENRMKEVVNYYSTGKLKLQNLALMLKVVFYKTNI